MKYWVYISINCDRRKLRKDYFISYVIDFVHMKKVLAFNLRLIFKNMKSFDIIDCKELDSNKPFRQH